MLHILNSSPWQCNLNEILRVMKISDDLLLIQNGVLGAIEGSQFLKILINSPVTISALKEDTDARGITNQISVKVAVVNYIHFVNLAVKHVNQISW